MPASEPGALIIQWDSALIDFEVKNLGVTVEVSGGTVLQRSELSYGSGGRHCIKHSSFQEPWVKDLGLQFVRKWVVRVVE